MHFNQCGRSKMDRGFNVITFCKVEDSIFLFPPEPLVFLCLRGFVCGMFFFWILLIKQSQSDSLDFVMNFSPLAV